MLTSKTGLLRRKKRSSQRRTLVSFAELTFLTFALCCTSFFIFTISAMMFAGSSGMLVMMLARFAMTVG